MIYPEKILKTLSILHTVKSNFLFMKKEATKSKNISSPETFHF